MLTPGHRPPLHLFIYGPPASGKRSVAEVLAESYGFKLLDNHLTRNVAQRLFAISTPEFFQLVERLRIELLAAAARAGVDVVATTAFVHPADRPHIERLVQASQSGNAQVAFVQLRPRKSVLEQRVTDPSRAANLKITDVGLLRADLERYDFMTPIHTGDLSIDNSQLTPDEVARIVVAALESERLFRPLRPHPGRLSG